MIVLGLVVGEVRSQKFNRLFWAFEIQDFFCVLFLSKYKHKKYENLLKTYTKFFTGQSFLRLAYLKWNNWFIKLP